MLNIGGSLNGVGLRRLGSILQWLPSELFTAGEVGGWWDPSDLSTLFQDDLGATPITADGQTVGRLSDKSGNGNHLTQATAAARPTYRTAGGLHWLEGDGVDDFLRSAFAISQPFDRVSGIRQITWVVGEHIFGGVSANAGVLYQDTISPRLSLYNGANAPSTDAAAVGTDAVIIERHAGATSQIGVDAGAYVTGNPGTILPGGVTLFNSNGGANSANARLYSLIMRQGTLTDAEMAQARTWAAKKQGRVL